MKKAFCALGTENWISVENLEDLAVLEKAIARVREIEDKMSAFKGTSEISRISQKAGEAPVALSGDVYDILKKAVSFSRLSKGAFDITVRPLSALWDFGHGTDHMPGESAIKDARQLCGYRNLVLDGKAKTAYLKTKGCGIDLGGVAKGYAADEVRRILLENGIISALINLGGNVVCVGGKTDGQPWKIGIQNPLSARGDFVTTVGATDRSVVTSAVNERFFIRDGKRYHHILDPRTGYPAESGLLSVTVISGSSTDCDMLATGVFVMGMEKGLRLIRKFGAEAVFITDSGDIFSTAGNVKH